MDFSGSDVNVVRSLIRIRGFGGLGATDERRMAYQGFNDGMGSPQKRRENYIHEGWTAPLSSPFNFHSAFWMLGWRAGHRRLPLGRPGAVSTGRRNTFAILAVCGGEVGAAGYE
jgi:hypothetical protein